MANWKETLEPYVKVIESAKTTALNPTAGEDLIVGAVIISDSGPATPTLITSQKEFLKTYAAEDVTQNYTGSLNSLYTSDPGSNLASTMWLNAYRLAGSTNLLVCRAFKAKDLIYAKPISKGDLNSYVLKNSEILKRVPSFKFVLDKTSIGYTDGWAISITDTGILGNRVTDDGPIYDYKVDSLPELVDKLNETSKFFSPSYKFYADEKCTELVEIEDIQDRLEDIVAVHFEEVYLGSGFLDTTVPLEDLKENETGELVPDQLNDYQVIGGTGTKVEVKGMTYILAVDPAWQELSEDSNAILDLNSSAFSGFGEVISYATNLYNSKSDLKIRIRRFNHNAVTNKVVSAVAGQEPESPYIVATKVLDKYTNGGTQNPAESIMKYDFYEFAVKDPDISGDWVLFNVGNIGGRGDITVADLNDSLSMIHLTLPDNLADLALNYYGYASDNYVWEPLATAENPAIGVPAGATVVNTLPEIKYTKRGTLTNLVKDSIYCILAKSHYKTYQVVVNDGGIKTTEVVSVDVAEDALAEGVTKVTAIPELNPYSEGDIFAIEDATISEYLVYQLKSNGEDEIMVDLSLNRVNSLGQVVTTILDVSDADLMQAWDRIEEDERYVVEGMTDLGNTYSILQNYMANIAVNSNYFYAASTINSTNYLTIASKKQKITKDTSKLYFLAPWDYDDGTVGYLYNASPSVLYWEAVSRNKTNNQEFAPVFGQNTGVVTPVKLAIDFKKSERQLLLTKKVNTVFHDVNIDRIYVNDNYTATTEESVRKEENIERTIVHISKNMPALLSQFKGRLNSSKTRQNVVNVIEYWFRNHLIPRTGELISDYRIICDEELNPAEEIRANRLNVKIQCQYLNSIKFITVYQEAYPLGVDFE